MIRYAPIPALPAYAMVVQSDEETVIAYNPTSICTLKPPDRWALFDDLAQQVEDDPELRPV